MISVVVPAWNAERTLAETLASILGQTRAPAEVIVVDDGSTDGTAGLPLLGRKPVRLISQPNLGASGALNTGIEAARGTYVAFLDADDLWPEDKLEKQAAVLDDDPGLSGAFGHVEAFACPTASTEDRARWDLASATGPGWLLGSAVVRRDRIAGERFDLALRAGYFVDWLDRLRLKGHRFSMIPDTVLRRRIHAGSLTQQKEEVAANFLQLAHRALQRRRGQASAGDPSGGSDDA